jgi:hypothetical protein
MVLPLRAAKTAAKESIVAGFARVSTNVEAKALRESRVVAGASESAAGPARRNRIPSQPRKTTPTRDMGLEAEVKAWVTVVSPKAPMAP